MAFFDFLHFFGDLFNSTEKAWRKLEPEVQAALIHGSGVIDIINKNLDQTPEFVWELIQKKFPDITKENLQVGLQKVNDDFKIAEGIDNPDLLTLIKNLQTYLASLKGQFWQKASSFISQTLAIVLAPNETEFAKIVSFIEFVYRTIINKK